MEIRDIDSIWLTCPVMSNINMIPVIGALTIAVKYPAHGKEHKITDIGGIQSHILGSKGSIAAADKGSQY